MKSANDLQEAVHTPRHIVLAAGGTGGHIYPALAIADRLRALDPTVRITFSGTQRGMESTLIPQNGYDFEPVRVIPFSRQEGWRRFLVPFILLGSSVRSAWRFRRNRVDLVIGMGGYPSLPAVLGARFAGIPRLLHESNAVPGKTNMFALSFTKNVGVVFPGVGGEAIGDKHDVRVLGLPIRTPDGPASEQPAPGIRERLGLAAGDRLVVVSGGSAGALSLTNAAIAAASLVPENANVTFLIKTGGPDFKRATAMLAQQGTGTKVHLIAQIEDMNDAYESATLFVGRAGAASIAELSQFGVPSVLIPYPWAAGDHQKHNAQRTSHGGTGSLGHARGLGADRPHPGTGDPRPAGFTRIASGNGRPRCNTGTPWRRGQHGHLGLLPHQVNIHPKVGNHDKQLLKRLRRPKRPGHRRRRVHRIPPG